MKRAEQPWQSESQYAVLLTKQKRYDEAEPLFKKALEGRRQKLYEDHPDTLESKNDLAMLYKEQRQYDKAEPLLTEAVEGRRVKLGDIHAHTLESLNNLIELYEVWNKPEEAEKWRAQLRKQNLWKSDIDCQTAPFLGASQASTFLG